MKKYTQLTDEERAIIGTMLCHRRSLREIAGLLRRAPSTISREILRNEYPNRGCYLSLHAGSMAHGRRRRSRQGTTYTAAQWKRVEHLLKLDYSPEQISGELLRNVSSGSATNRSRIGHWDIDTVMGKNRACILTIVDRKTGYVLIGKLSAITIHQTNRRLRKLVERHPEKFRTITADNGCEFHGYEQFEETHGFKFYFAPPHHSWERGTNENTNGLIRQYLPKGKCLNSLTQAQGDRIAHKLNTRPRKRYGYRTPEELFN
ncbi:MAG: IS30 family transposase [Verrucomicrobiota bacterium]